MDLGDDHGRLVAGSVDGDIHGAARCVGRQLAMTESIGHRDHRAATIVDGDAPIIAARVLAVFRNPHRAELEPTDAVARCSTRDARHENRAAADGRVDVERAGEPRHRAEPRPGAARRGVAVAQGTIEIGDARAMVDRYRLTTGTPGGRDRRASLCWMPPPIPGSRTSPRRSPTVQSRRRSWWRSGAPRRPCWDRRWRWRTRTHGRGERTRSLPSRDHHAGALADPRGDVDLVHG